MKKLLLTGIALVGAALVFAQPRLVAHRGFYTTPGSDENTISSLINAQQLGVYGVEFDVNRTSDGELIVVHGPKVGDRLDAQRDTYAEISRVVLPGGNRIPTLREFLEQGRKDPGTKLILELKKHKTPEIETRIVEEIVSLCKKLAGPNGVHVLQRARLQGVSALGSAEQNTVYFQFALDAHQFRCR